MIISFIEFDSSPIGVVLITYFFFSDFCCRLAISSLFALSSMRRKTVLAFPESTKFCITPPSFKKRTDIPSERMSGISYFILSSVIDYGFIISLIPNLSIGEHYSVFGASGVSGFASSGFFSSTWASETASAGFSS